MLLILHLIDLGWTVPETNWLVFSFTYFPDFEALASNPLNDSLDVSIITSFTFGNPNNYEIFEWNPNFGMTAFMTPVNESFNPLSTRVLYLWKPDSEYQLTSDRSQSALMKYTYNPNGITPPRNSETGFLINYNEDIITEAIGFSNFLFGQVTLDANTQAQISYVGGLWTANPESNQGVPYDAKGNPIYTDTKEGYTYA